MTKKKIDIDCFIDYNPENPISANASFRHAYLRIIVQDYQYWRKKLTKQNLIIYIKDWLYYRTICKVRQKFGL